MPCLNPGLDPHKFKQKIINYLTNKSQNVVIYLVSYGYYTVKFFNKLDQAIQDLLQNEIFDL